MALALWLVMWNYGSDVSSLRRDITQTLAETAAAEFLSAAEKLDGVVCAEWRDGGFHGPVVLVAQREQVSSHATRSLALRLRRPRWASLAGRVRVQRGGLRN